MNLVRWGLCDSVSGEQAVEQEAVSLFWLGNDRRNDRT